MQAKNVVPPGIEPGTFSVFNWLKTGAPIKAQVVQFKARIGQAWSGYVFNVEAYRVFNVAVRISILFMTYALINICHCLNACDLHTFTPPSPIISLPFWYSINSTPTPSNRQPRLGPTQRLSTPPRNITLLPQDPQDPNTLLPPPQPLLQ
ncbi:Uncharacterized protein HZ326_18909, partial [Fusarium oxysporum f. sp. albedinis]